MDAGRGWTTEESVSACCAYLTASEDPFSGNGKKKEVFRLQMCKAYEDILEKLREKETGLRFASRTGDAIIQRHRKARCESIKFEGIIGSMRKKNPTGSPTDEDFLRAATAVYNGDATIANMSTYFRNASVPCGPTFLFLKCLYFFRTSSA